MTLRRYLLRRALFAVLFILLVSSAAVVLTLAATGDFLDSEVFNQPPDVIAKQRAALGLDRPATVQYFDWLSRAVRFDFGMSLLYTRPVGVLLGERALNTMVLASSALLLATIIGIPLGLFTGLRPRGAGSFFVRMLSMVMLSTPPLVAALGLMLLAARTHWFPVGGMSTGGIDHLSWAQWLIDVARHIPLPALALALPLIAMLERLQSQALIDASREPFIGAAQARGLTREQAMLKHGWRVALTPVLSLYGLIIGSLFSGSFIVEVITNWPGLGRLMFDALRARDLYLVAGCAAAGALFLSIGTFISDALLAVADPRARFTARA